MVCVTVSVTGSPLQKRKRRTLFGGNHKFYNTEPYRIIPISIGSKLRRWVAFRDTITIAKRYCTPTQLKKTRRNGTKCTKQWRILSKLNFITLPSERPPSVNPSIKCDTVGIASTDENGDRVIHDRKNRHRLRDNYVFLPSPNRNLRKLHSNCLANWNSVLGDRDVLPFFSFYSVLK